MSVRLSPEIEQRLEALARETGRSTAQLTREAMFRHMDAIEDYYLHGRAERTRAIAPYGAEPGVDLGL